MASLPHWLGRESLASMLTDPPPECRTLRIEKLPKWVKGLGPIILSKVLGEANAIIRSERAYCAPITEMHEIGSLSDRQRRALVIAIGQDRSTKRAG